MYDYCQLRELRGQYEGNFRSLWLYSQLDGRIVMYGEFRLFLIIAVYCDCVCKSRPEMYDYCQLRELRGQYEGNFRSLWLYSQLDGRIVMYGEFRLFLTSPFPTFSSPAKRFSYPAKCELENRHCIVLEATFSYAWASNVLLDKEMNAILGDFGLARMHDHGQEAAASPNPNSLLGRWLCPTPVTAKTGLHQLRNAENGNQFFELEFVDLII
ncbi:unnamed protein product [Fraxinus pennsylvanica]|uniref:Uncharacterized protein n=1 Tax=Fraxinus pennsylvanica TaxID=56036 RepID=A0AAD1YW12_9LAMI|nr:unnamed protein product [Fraxinus pennsylvanica]